MFSPDQFVAHRGYATKYPENTLTAVTAALNAGAIHVEVDIQFSRDGVPMLYHDTKLERISDMGGTIFDYRAEALEEMKAYYPRKFGTQFNNVPISSALEFSHLVSVKNQAHYYVELKMESIKQFCADSCLESLSEIFKDTMDNITLISDDHEAAKMAKTKYGFKQSGIVFRDWERRNTLIEESEADIAYINYKRIPDGDEITGACPIVTYEIADPVLAESILERGAAKVESFAIGEMIEALCQPTTMS